MQMPRLLVPILCFVPLAAQQPAADPESLHLAFAQLRTLESGTFQSSEATDIAMLRRMRAMVGGQERDLDGSWHGDLCSYTLEDGDTLLARNGRRVVQNSDGEWRLRLGTDAQGTPLPYLFDPRLFHDALRSLAEADRKIAHVDTGKAEAGRVTFGITLTGAAATDFFLSGAIPSGGGGPGPMIRIGGRAAGGPPDVTVDLAFEVDTAGGRIERIRAKAYRTDAMAGNIRIQTAGGEEIEPEAEADDTKEFDADGKRLYKNGLPVRKLGGDVTLIELTVRLKNLGSANAIEVPASAEKLLR